MDANSPKTRIFYVCHGQSEANEKSQNQMAKSQDVDPQLTNLGHQQSTITTKFLFENYIQKHSSHVIVIHSHLERTKQTAKPLIELLNQTGTNHTVKDCQGFHEHIGSGKRIPDYLLYKRISKDETWHAFWIRVKNFNRELRQMIKCNPDSTFVIFGHGLFFACLMAYQWCQESLDHQIPKVSPDLYNCSISVTEFIHKDNIDGGWRWASCNTNYLNHLMNINWIANDPSPKIE